MTALLFFPASLLGAYLVYCIGVQYERGGWWRLLAPVAIAALLASWFINHTLGRLLYGRPNGWRDTFSKHTARRRLDLGWRGRFARLVAAVLNFPAHDEKHIK